MSVSLAASSGVACRNKGGTPTSDGSMKGSGGAFGADARVDATDAAAAGDAAADSNADAANTPADRADANREAMDAADDARDANRDAEIDSAALDGPADGARALDAPTVDLIADGLGDRPSDAAVDATGPDLSGGVGCAGGSLCGAIRAAYSEAVLTAQSCSGGDSSCAVSVVGSLGCLGCPVWVSDRTALDALRSRFTAAGCQACFYGSPTGDRCHPTVCPDLGTPMCAPGASGQGTCVDRPKNRTCPLGIKTGTACTASDDYCVGGGNVCTCTDTTLTWSC